MGARGWVLVFLMFGACTRHTLSLDTDDPAPVPVPDRPQVDARQPDSQNRVVIAFPGSCDPVGQGCGAGRRCAPDCKALVFVCIRDEIGAGAQAAVCSHHQDCKVGFACTPTDDTPRCLRYCRTDADCPGGSQCETGRFPCSPDKPNQAIPQSVCRERRPRDNPP